MVDVANRAGVSLKTVSRVVNNAPNVQPDLIERVLAAVAELGFRRNHLAGSLRSGQASATIGLLIEEIANPFYATIAEAAAEVVRQHDMMLIIASSEEDPSRERHLLRDTCARRVGILLDSVEIHTMRERLDGAYDERAPAGAPYDTRLVRDGIRDPAAAARAVADLLDRPDLPTAFFTLNNRITVGAIEELCRRAATPHCSGSTTSTWPAWCRTR
ncbi:hypothetical protein GCM10010151_37860 [Actinoallomurus spadix]|uniref:HTH lacI-type domain-containing protein n=2 Tax=Actinoallomurus spadix TaxID=79912 RepID=A0ABP3GIV3_9ACTN